VAKVANFQEMTLKIDSLLPGTREMARHDCDYGDHGVSAPAHRAVLLQDFENSRSASHSNFCAVHHCRLVLANLPVVRLCYRAKIASTSVDEVAWLWVRVCCIYQEAPGVASGRHLCTVRHGCCGMFDGGRLGNEREVGAAPHSGGLGEYAKNHKIVVEENKITSEKDHKIPSERGGFAGTHKVHLAAHDGSKQRHRDL